MAITPAKLEATWKKALAFWGLGIQADLPRLDQHCDAVAFIDLQTRAVTVNPRRLASMRAEDSLEAVLAHELGHHLRYPHSLSTLARLQMLEQELLPVRGGSLLNLFTDALINIELGRDPAMRTQIAQVFSGMQVSASAAEKDPAFFFYLTCLEESYGLAPHALTGAAGPALEQAYPGCRAEAQLMAEELPNLAPNIFTQFLYFSSVMSQFIGVDGGEDRPSRDPMAGDYGQPTAGDYADAIERSAQEEGAIREAKKRGWVRGTQVPDRASSRERRAGALAGMLGGDPQKLTDAMALHYRRLAEQHLFKPPPVRSSAEPYIPSTLSPWDLGDSPREIDWLASVIASGEALGIAQPLKRDLIADDDPGEVPGEARIRLELYLDVSGSMPDPKASTNPMTLAAQVLAISAIRAGGQVRAVIYSSNNVAHWEWTRSELEISRFLLTYIGGGTNYPFDLLQKSLRECAREQPIRIVLTDSDFASNLAASGAHPKLVREAAKQSAFIALLNGAASKKEQWVKEISSAGARTIPVQNMAGFPQVAAALARALFDRAEVTRRTEATS